MSIWQKRWATPLAVFVVSASVYCGVAGTRLFSPSPNNHYVHLAAAWLDGRLDLGSVAPGTNDWACFDHVRSSACPPGRYAFPEDSMRYRWYVSFPPLPAALLLPWVAVFGLGFLDRVFWFLVAGLTPTFFYLVLRALRERGWSGRTHVEDLLVTALLAFGSVFFFAAVQGSVWFAAHVVATACVCLYVLFSLNSRAPSLAGLFLGLAFLSRPATILLAPFFAVEAWSAYRGTDTVRASHAGFARVIFRFLVPIGACVALAMVHNVARFDDPTEFGHRFLQIRWRTRIETWGLFDVHYLSRNLTVFFASLPWLYESRPFVRISRHGLALWFTTPNLLWSLVPKQIDSRILGLWAAIVPTALCGLLYQNTGWVQFGYRFALDYLPLLLLLVVLNGRRFDRLFWAFAAFSFFVNTFGALTFDRRPEFYDADTTQEVIFKPEE
ncbi:MAG: hypothetical protein WBG86_18480 [Polyangiales bacterium]